MCDSEANKVYKTVEYWDDRFKEEDSYEWLARYRDVKELLQKHAPDIFQPDSSLVSENAKPAPRVLIVGCGNSSFSYDLHCAGVRNSVSIDYSKVVIERMSKKHPELEWKKMDMTKMGGFQDCVFDYIIDKAAMDALVTDEGDPWNPSESSLNSTRNMITEVVRTLKPGGKFLQISFQQPHFRNMYLRSDDFEEQQALVDQINVGLGYFFYTLQKKS
uniref:Methyltransferase domain-containing protein n=1 Tax=Aplanochytrium stocchinoi TaxID=215587 RepID=A0A7S3LKC0_9STRA|mmetsp:Transcript_9434/g.11747  ORF Transcript_9434/g.11747 Transcript_9434/m.11747 type:complete len:217 (+) Transcript_9434:140-790(+)